jgi:hypothetical protein
MAIPNPFSSSSGIAAANRKAAAQKELTMAGAAKQADVTKKGYAQGKAEYAPTLTNIGDIYAQEQAGRGAYLGALGVGTPEEQAAARAAYANYQAPINEYGVEDLMRYAGQTGTEASGANLKDLFRYGEVTRFDPWLQALSGFNPLGANAQYGDLAGKLAGLDVGRAQDLSGIFGNKYNTLAGIEGNRFDTIAGVNQNAAGNVLNAGIAGVNALGNFAGMAKNPAGAAAGAATKLPQYASNLPATPTTYGGTFPGFGYG